MSDTENRIKKGFTKVENKIITSQNVSPTEKLVIVCLLMHKMDKECCFPSFDKISEETGYHRNTVKKTIKSLDDKRFIRIVKNKGKSNKYFFNV